MPAPRSFIAALYRYGATGTTEKTQLETWRTEALTAIAENKGGTTVSGSANGVAFTLGGPSSLSYSDWYGALDLALQWVDKGIAPPSRIHARVI